MRKFGLLNLACVAFVLCTAAALVSSTRTTFTTLVRFDGTNGASPMWAPLVQGLDGNFYGTTSEGGNNNCTNGCGTVFKITPDGELTTLHQFNGSDGASPSAGLLQANDGNFYSTTTLGGETGAGTVFKITPRGKLTLLHSFRGADGSTPYSALVQATDGNFYGTAYNGGAHGFGTVFRITPRGKLTTLYSFCSQGGGACTDGQGPFAGLIQSADGNLYGTTTFGGDHAGGTVFRISLAGQWTRLYSFSQLNGFEPSAGLVQATDGNFYGTTRTGGINVKGTVFKITPEGKLTALHVFDGTDGSVPEAGLVQGTDGSFYGATTGGGAKGDGTVFKITSQGKLTTLHNFDAPETAPYAALMQGTDGNFYGSVGAAAGGCVASDCGAVFRVSTGLAPFVETRPASGQPGAIVRILGSNLAGTTRVKFHGVPAVFVVVSNSEIAAAVPACATTGDVVVTTPAGRLTSNVPFRVMK